jgi:hypothetical protein
MRIGQSGFEKKDLADAQRRAPGAFVPGANPYSAVMGAKFGDFTTGGGFHLPVRASDFGA